MESIDEIKTKKIITKMLMIPVFIIIVLLSILVGTPLKENTRIITIISIVIFLITIIYYQFIKKKNKDVSIKINGLDIAVSILCISPFIPLIFKTAVNIEDSINVAIRYITILMLYFTLRIDINLDQKIIDYVIRAIIFTGVISAVIGIDNMTFKLFLNPLYKIGVPFVVNIENRMFGNFGYANAFSISLLIPFFLSLGKYLKSKNNLEKNIYVGLNFLFISCVILSYSKAIYIITGLFIVFYVFLNKEKKTRIQMLCNIVIIIICSVIYTKIFMNLYQQKNNIAIWIITIEFIFIANISNMIMIKLIERIKLNRKIFCGILIIFFILIILFILIGLELKMPLILFENATQTSEIKYKIANIKPDTDYQFVFNIEAKSLYDHRIYSIQIIEEDEHYETIKEHEIKVKTFLGEKNIEFRTNSRTEEIALIFKSSNPREQKGLTIRELKINGKEYTLNYAYLPASVVNKIKTLRINNLSISGRVTFYKDAIKLIKENYLTGIGGNGWVYKYSEVASYDYETTQVHSYPLQLLLEFGFVAFSAYITIIIYLIKYFIKGKEKNMEILMGIFAIILHSMIDFDLSFLNLLVYTFLLIAIVSSDIVDYKNIKIIKNNI